MKNLSLRQKIIGILIMIGAILIAIFQRGLYSTPPDAYPGPVESITPTLNPSEEIKIVSTTPNPLDEALILPDQTIELTFNFPLENQGEFKYSLEPALDHKIELSSDKRTVKIIPQPIFKLGTTYTLTVKPQSKFYSSLDFKGQKILDKDFIIHFKTIEYKGV